MLINLINKIIVRVFPAELKLSTFISYYEREVDALERGNYGGLILTDHQSDSETSRNCYYEVNKLTGRHKGDVV